MTSNYIPRKLLEREKYYRAEEYAPFLESYLDLYGLIVNKNKRIVLLGDAGYGKSTELIMITLKLIEEKNEEFIPLYIELSTYTDEDILEYVRMKIGKDYEGLLQNNQSKLLFLFDEFDQVTNKQIATRKLKNFIKKYSESTFVIACRTNFYSGQLDEFDIFVLVPLNSNDIIQYATKLIDRKGEEFVKELERYSLFELAKNPFFLHHLIEIYSIDERIPNSRAEIFSRIITISLQKDEKKLDKYDLKQTYPGSAIEKDLMYQSVVMETLQRNFLSMEELNSLFEDSKKEEIICALSLIKKSFFSKGDVYQFQHNNFQEYLAAKALSNLDLRTILEFISFTLVARKKPTLSKILNATSKYIEFKMYQVKLDRIIEGLVRLIRRQKIKRINPSWVNTVAFLCQIRYRKDLFEYLLKHQPELTLKFEKSRIDDVLRKKIFMKIFENYAVKKIWFDRDRIDVDDLANFADPDDIYYYLIKYASSGEHFVQRYNAIEILGKMKGLRNGSLRKLLIQTALNQNEDSSVRDMSLYALTWQHMNTRETIDSLLELQECEDDTILSGFYYLISESNIVDKYVDILLGGISHAEKSSFMGLGMYIEQGLKKIHSTDGIKKIINHFVNNPMCIRHYFIEKALEIVVNNLIQAFEVDSSLYYDAKELLASADKEYMLDSIFQFRNFFRSTGTALKLFKELYEQGMESNYTSLGFLADDECIDFLIQEHQDCKMSDGEMQIFINFHSNISSNEFDLHLARINEKTGKFFPIPSKDYEKERYQKLQEYIQIVINKGEFLKEIKRVFDGESKEELSYKDVHNILIKRSESEENYNEFVLREIERFLEQSKHTRSTFDKLKKRIDQWDYNTYVLIQTFNMLSHTRELELTDEQITMISNICLEKIDEGIDFRNALKAGLKGASTKSLLASLWYFLRKYELAYPEEILLDLLSFDWIEDHGFVGIGYLEDRLPVDKIKHRIIENLEQGIKFVPVLKNHIDCCKRLKMEEARDVLYKIVQDTEAEMENRLLALNTLGSLENSIRLLERLLDIDELELFTEVSKILLASQNKKAKEKLVEKLSSKNEELALKSAKILVDEQNLKAIRFYANHIIKTKRFYEDFPHRSCLIQIKTVKALPILMKLLKFSYEYKKQIKQDEFNPLINEVINVLKNMALESPKNFNKVSTRLRKFVMKYESRLENVNFLNRAIDNIEATFLINYQKSITIEDAKKKFNRLLRQHVYSR